MKDYLIASVIIPAYNAENTIDACLNALEKQTITFERIEIIVVDDNSTDATVCKVKQHKDIKLLSQEHKGPAAARNLGADRARGKILIFTDADCVPSSNWAEQMIKPFQDSEVVGVKGVYLSQQKSFIARFVQLEYEDKYDQMACETRIDFIDTYSAAYCRNIFLKEGGFDTTFPTACVEDQEFSFRLAAKGYKMVFARDAQVYHIHANTLEKYWRKKFKIGYWKVYLHKKHPKKIIRDSHTPQILKAQILLIPCFLIAGLFCILNPALWRICLVPSTVFFITTIPFVIKAWRKDRQVALISPLILFIRTLSLSIGLGVGLLVQIVQYFAQSK
jgi:glycosyltransferase involved in cell wall biosynthesis